MEDFLLIPLKDLKSCGSESQDPCSTDSLQIAEGACDEPEEAEITAELVASSGLTDLDNFQKVVQEGGQCHAWGTGSSSTFCSADFWSAMALCSTCHCRACLNSWHVTMSMIPGKMSRMR